MRSRRHGSCREESRGARGGAIWSGRKGVWRRSQDTRSFRSLRVAGRKSCDFYRAMSQCTLSLLPVDGWDLQLQVEPAQAVQAMSVLPAKFRAISAAAGSCRYCRKTKPNWKNELVIVVWPWAARKGSGLSLLTPQQQQSREVTKVVMGRFESGPSCAQSCRYFANCWDLI